MSSEPNIRSAIEMAGSQRKLADRSGLSQQYISAMLNRQRGISAEAAVAIERATGGHMPRWRLRPDLWSQPMKDRVLQGAA